MGSHDSTPFEPSQQPDSSSPPLPSGWIDKWWVVALGIFFSGVAVTAITFYRLGWNCSIDSQFCWFFLMFIGPYGLLSSFTFLAWRTSLGQVVYNLITCLVLLLGVIIVAMGKPPSGPGSMAALAPLMYNFSQYVLSAVGVIVSIVVWTFAEWRSKQITHGVVD